MLCPYCNCTCAEEDRFCSHCGALLNAPAAEKKGHHWVPILIMVLLCALGTGLFFAFPDGSNPSSVRGFSTGDMPWFLLDDGVLYFSEAYYDGSSELTVPESIGGVAVEALGEGCFENCRDLTGIFLPDSLQAIGKDAFRGCTSLRGMDIPDSVGLIGESAFYGCTALEAVRISDQTKVIGTQAFYGCNKLQFIYFQGKYIAWNDLYDEFISPYTTVFCEDGSYYQGGDPY